MKESVHQRKLMILILNELIITIFVHVLVGTIFILIGLIRLINYHFSAGHHLGLESAILYWQTY